MLIYYQMEPTKKTGTRTIISFVINNLLLASGLIMIVSGMIMQIGFHMGSHPGHGHQAQGHSIAYEDMRVIDHNKIVGGFNYSDWSAIHKIVVIVFFLLITWHLYIHWKWIMGLIRKHLMGKNSQLIILSALFLLVALTGFIPWGIDLWGGSGESRMFYIEIHDKLTLLFMLFLLLHIIKRARWYTTTYERLRKG